MTLFGEVIERKGLYLKGAGKANGVGGKKGGRTRVMEFSAVHGVQVLGKPQNSAGTVSLLLDKLGLFIHTTQQRRCGEERRRGIFGS